MIGLGAKYLKAAGFGRYRITAASLGNLDLLGSVGWLKGATKAAILAAFGDDGWAVINATNAYLNGIAASDRDKATALAALINEDPMMVCSLGLEPEGVTMPIRWLKSDGNSYIDSGVLPLNTTGFYADMKQDVINESNMRYLMRGGDGSNVADFSIGYWQSGVIQLLWNTYYNNGISQSTQRRQFYLNYMNDRKAVFGGTTYSPNPLPTLNEASVHWTISFPHNVQASVVEAKITQGTSVAKHFIPCKHKTLGNGMLDLVNVVFYPNAGTGQFTIPDISYTPSTP